MDYEPIPNTATIEGVHLHIDYLKTQPKTMDDLKASGFFDHLPAHKQEPAYVALHKMVHDNDVPEKVAAQVEVSQDVAPIDKGLKKATSAGKDK